MFRSVQFQKLFPTRRSRSQPILALGFKDVTLATTFEVSNGKVQYVYASILEGNELEPLIIISSHDSITLIVIVFEALQR